MTADGSCGRETFSAGNGGFIFWGMRWTSEPCRTSSAAVWMANTATVRTSRECMYVCLSVCTSVGRGWGDDVPSWE